MKSDVRELGKLLYELVTGKRFEGDTSLPPDLDKILAYIIPVMLSDFPPSIESVSEQFDPPAAQHFLTYHSGELKPAFDQQFGERSQSLIDAFERAGPLLLQGEEKTGIEEFGLHETVQIDFDFMAESYLGKLSQLDSETEMAPMNHAHFMLAQQPKRSHSMTELT